MARIAFLVLLVSAAAFAAADDVIVGTGKNFDKIIKDNAFVVAEFYAPWCGHCKNLEPEYAKAATELKTSGLPIKLVKVDATEEDNKPLATKFGVQGFPTIKIFRNGDTEKPAEYKGPRDAAGIVSYLTKKSQPASSLLSSAAEVETLKKNLPVIVGLFKDDSSPELKTFQALADKLADEATFGHAFDAKLVEGAAKTPSVTIFKTDKMVQYDGKFDAAELEAWVDAKAAPTLVDLEDPKTRSIVDKALQSSEPKFFAFLSKDSKNYDSFIKELTKTAEAKTEPAYFVLIDSGNKHACDYFGIKKDDTPAFVIQHGAKKFIKSHAKPKEASSYYKDFLAGKLVPHIKSEDEPKDNDGPVKIVTAKSFDKIVFGGKNVLIEFYAPWCGHCKQLTPIYEEVGKAFADNDDVVIAKMDATANDVISEKFDVKGFPTLNFVSKDGTVSTYSGGRTEKDLIAYVTERSGSKASPASSASTEDHSEL